MTQRSEKPTITVYTDGACSGNPGPGGYAAILIDEAGRKKELSQGYRRTTNNRMELLGVISALDSLKLPCTVRVHTDSQYIVKAINEHWLQNWVKRGWKKSDKQPVLNVDLWKRLLAALSTHDVKFEWTKGHAGDPLNERCDELAVEAAHSDDLLIDEGAK